MGRIHVLDDVVINKIAAGEVVERPASVVKELVENALDAGASKIEVKLELGGTRSIVVSDNGGGIAKDDVPRALLRHATSKIRAADDLFNIGTMGFRGEALASIASVSRISLSTRTAASEDGVKVTSSGGEDVLTVPWNGPVGTTIAVENLFYNMPVRAKFLKAPATETSHCLELLQAFALCHPTVALSLTHNGRELFRVAAVAEDCGVEAAMRQRAEAILSRDVAEALVYVSGTSRYGAVEALVSPPGLEKASSKFVFSFVNGRWVKDKVLRYGIMRGYHSHILKGRFPVAIVHVKLDPSLVDVNVHPAKTELRFQYPSELQNFLALSLRERLRDAEWAGQPQDAAADGLQLPLAPKPSWTQEAPLGASSGWSRPAESGRASSGYAAFAGRSSGPTTSSVRRFEGATRVDTGSPATLWTKADIDAALGPSEAAGPDVIPWDELEPIGAFASCYLFFRAGERLLVMDQHAFHERVLFERLSRDERLLESSQRLLVPESLEMSPTEVEHLRERRHLLSQRGFAYETEGDCTIAVMAVPAILAGRSIPDLFAALAQDVGEAGSNAEMARLILATAACHAAVRAGEDLGDNELKQLLAEARTVDFYHNCPHGRRVFRWWTKSQVAQWFDR